MRGLRAIMTERDEDRWRAVRRTIAPAYGPAAIRCVHCCGVVLCVVGLKLQQCKRNPQ